jgi:hypothetical protein
MANFGVVGYAETEPHREQSRARAQDERPKT